MNSLGIIIGGILLVTVVSFVFYLFYYSKRVEWAQKAGFFFVLLGFIFELAYLLSSLGPEFFSFYNMLVILSAIIVLAFILIKQFYNWDIVGLFVTPSSAILLAMSIIAFHIHHKIPVQGGVLLYAHIATSLIGEAGYFVASMIALIYLISHHRLKAKSRMIPGESGYFPPLEKLDMISFRTLVACFPFSTLGMLFGFSLDFIYHGAIFSIDFAKEIFVLVLWLLFVITISGRKWFDLKGKRMMIFILAGQVVVFVILTVSKLFNTGNHNF